MSTTRRRFAVVTAAALALAAPLLIRNADAATTPSAAKVNAAAAAPAAASSFTAAQVLAGIQKNSTAANQVNTKPHINTMTRAMNVNVYQVAPGVYAYSSSLAVDDDGSDPDTDPAVIDHLTTDPDSCVSGARVSLRAPRTRWRLRQTVMTTTRPQSTTDGSRDHGPGSHRHVWGL